jgi:hypothetical protein
MRHSKRTWRKGPVLTPLASPGRISHDLMAAPSLHHQDHHHRPPGSQVYPYLSDSRNWPSMACGQRPGHLRRLRLVAESAILRQLGGACTIDRWRVIGRGDLARGATVPSSRAVVCVDTASHARSALWTATESLALARRRCPPTKPGHPRRRRLGRDRTYRTLSRAALARAVW